MKSKTNGVPEGFPKLDSRESFEDCSFNYALGLIGGKWKPTILYCIANGANRFGVMQRCIPLISKQMLTTQLRELEEDGIVERKVYAEVPPRVEYNITPNGASVLPLLEAINQWGKEQMKLKRGTESLA